MEFLEFNNSPHTFIFSCINLLSQIYANLCTWQIVLLKNCKSDSQLWQQTMKSDTEINLYPQYIDTLHVWGEFQVYVPHALMVHELSQQHHPFATLELKQNLAYLRLCLPGSINSWIAKENKHLERDLLEAWSTCSPIRHLTWRK